MIVDAKTIYPYVTSELSEKAKKEKKRKVYFFKQKLLGVGLIIISIAIPFLLGDATASIFLFVLGVAIVGTKEKVLMNDYFYDNT